MADVFSQRSENGDVVAMARREDRPGGASFVEIDGGGPDVAGTVFSRDEARQFGKKLIAWADVNDPEATGEAAARGGYIHLRPEILDRRFAAAMTRGL